MATDVGVGGREHTLDLLVDRLDDPAQLAPRRADVLELLLEERVTLLQLGELLERQRVDRTEQAQLTVELTHPRLGTHAVRKRRRIGRLGDLGFDVEVVAEHLDRRLQPEARLGLVDVRPSRPLADLIELALGIRSPAALRVESRPRAL